MARDSLPDHAGLRCSSTWPHHEHFPVLGVEMKRRWVLLIIAANLIGLAVLVFFYPHYMVAPGPLISAHANLETNCFTCHAPLRGPVADLCISCHKVADIGLRTTEGLPVVAKTPIKSFHQGLTAQNCMACHTDHTTPALTSRTRPLFSHLLLNPETRENCTSCHTAPKTAVHSVPPAQCTQCHSQTAWKPATFDHTRLFVLDKDHNVPCTTCHMTSDQWQYTCYGCHKHTVSNVQAKHIRKGISNFTNCVACHRSAHDGDGERGEAGKSREGGRRDRKHDD